ncbi:MAG: thioredoxin family protein [Pirellulales bacterium]|nr:thioredoxin family protein [Pirellulales bacterium]
MKRVTALLLSLAGTLFFVSPACAEEVPAASWRTNYGEAYAAAKREGKMLLIYFYRDGEDAECRRFQKETLDAPLLQQKLQAYVCVKTPVEEEIVVEGRTMRRIDHSAFQEMLGRPGIAIVDLKSKDPQLFGKAVSTFPLTKKLWYTPEMLKVILDLPRGTLTQRTIIFAVRTHPDHALSTDGRADPFLLEEARHHSQYQAQIGLQGHHRWEARFPRIAARLRGEPPREVCAESWPGEHLVEAAVGCVYCWRFSSGHWGAVRAYHRRFGYDMKRGRNGIWYATGILGG